MMLNYDVYVLSALRDSQNINRFIDVYSDRSSVEDRGNEELMVMPIGITDENNMSLGMYDWIPAININNVIRIGTSQPIRAFRFYLPSVISDISTIIVTFTADNKIIYGLSIDIEDEEKSLILAGNYLKEIYGAYAGIVGGVFYEESAPLHTTEFMKLLENHSLKSI